jgi:hypothetical protein
MVLDPDGIDGVWPTMNGFMLSVVDQILLWPNVFRSSGGSAGHGFNENVRVKGLISFNG